MALGPQQVGKLLDYEQYIAYQIERTGSRIKGTEVLNACLVLLAAVLGVLFLEVVLDHLIGLPFWLRGVTLWAGGFLALGFVLKRIVQPLVSPVNGLYAAKAIEDAHPTLHNSLISYLDLRRHGEGVPLPFLAAVEARAVHDLLEVDVETVVDLRELMRTTYVLSGIVVLIVLYATITPRGILDAAGRALLSDDLRPAPGRVRTLKPDDQASFSIETNVDSKHASVGERDDSALTQPAEARWRPLTTERLAKLHRVLENLDARPSPFQSPQRSPSSAQSKPGTAPPDGTRPGFPEKTGGTQRPEGRTPNVGDPDAHSGPTGVHPPSSSDGSVERQQTQGPDAPRERTHPAAPRNAETDSAMAVRQAGRPNESGQGGKAQPLAGQTGQPGDGVDSDSSRPMRESDGKTAEPGRVRDGGRGRGQADAHEPNPGQPRPRSGQPTTSASLDTNLPPTGKDERTAKARPAALPPVLPDKPGARPANQRSSTRQLEIGKEVAQSAPGAGDERLGAGPSVPSKPVSDRAIPKGSQANLATTATRAGSPPRAENKREELPTTKAVDNLSPAQVENAQESPRTEQPIPKGSTGEQKQPGASDKVQEAPTNSEKQNDAQARKSEEPKNATPPRNLSRDRAGRPTEPAREMPPKPSQPHSPSGSKSPESDPKVEPGAPGPPQLPFPGAGLPGKTPPGLPSGNPGPAGAKPSEVPHQNSTSPGRNRSDRSPKTKSSPLRAALPVPARKKSNRPPQSGLSLSRRSRRRGQGTAPPTAGLPGLLQDGSGPGSGDGPTDRGRTGTAEPTGGFGPRLSRVPEGQFPKEGEASRSSIAERSSRAGTVIHSGGPGRATGYRSGVMGAWNAGPSAPEARSLEPVIRRLRALIEEEHVSPEILDAVGVTSREELDQFVTALELETLPRIEPGPGREIAVGPKSREDFSPPPSLTERDLRATARIGTTRAKGQVKKDKVRGNNEGSRFVVPPELRAGFNAYRTALSRSTR